MARSRLTQLIHAALADIERDVDTIGDLFEGRAGKARLQLYAGYRDERRVRVKGRALDARGRSVAGDGFVARLRAMLAVYNSAELAGVRVAVDAGGVAVETVTDAEGYFDVEIAVDQALPEHTRWEAARVRLLDQPTAEPLSIPILAPGTDGHWGVISDIDDTVIETGATDFLKNWRRVLIERPGERLAVPGAASLYQSIATRPFFYVSSSPWNLYPLIAEFMALNRIPPGPMFLKDYGIDADTLLHGDHDTHKLAAIETILAFYPRLKFLLIGDNGQRDVSIYARAVADYPARVAGVYIRDVDGSCKAGPEGALLRGIEAKGIPVFCGAGFDDAVAMAKALDIEKPAEVAEAVSVPPDQAPA